MIQPANRKCIPTLQWHTKLSFGGFHTPSGCKRPVEGPKGCHLTDAVRNALSIRTADMQKPQLCKLRFLQQERGEEKMKKGNNLIYVKVLSPVPLLGRVCFA